MQKNEEPVVDVVLVGAGIMSATLGLLLKQLEPGMTIEIYERLDHAAAESSDAWNNAGTGHSAFCELNYTPQKEDGSIDISKAIKIAESFEVSKQFWAYLVEQNIVQPPGSFIRSIPHMSFVWGDKNVGFLSKRYQTMQTSPLFQGMHYTEDPVTIAKWTPLIMEGRDRDEPMASTKMDIGTDVNFGSLTRCMFDHLGKMEGVQLHFGYEVRDLRKKDGNWNLKLKHEKNRRKNKGPGQVCFYWSRRWFTAPSSEIRHSGRKGFWRFPGKWSMASMHQ